MGLDSRDYMVEDDDAGAGIGGLNAVNVVIIINAIVFVLWQIKPLQPFLAVHFTVSADGLQVHKHVWTALTSAISHESLVHLFFNCLFLHLVGRVLEEMRGPRWFVATYILGAIGGSLGHALLTSATGRPFIPALGASGAVLAVTAAAAAIAPRHRILVFGLLPLPLWGALLIYLGADLLDVLRERVIGVSGTISNGGHLGGMVVGLLFGLLALRRRTPAGGRRTARAGKDAGALERLRGLLTPRPRLRVLPPIERARDVVVDEREPALVEGVDPATAERVDDLLKKIHDDGIGSLTPEEKSFLERASSRYRK